jgi:hypothetical protein
MDVVEIFDAAVDVPEAEREAFLQRACGGDETLLRKVKALPGTTSSRWLCVLLRSLDCCSASRPNPS